MDDTLPSTTIAKQDQSRHQLTGTWDFKWPQGSVIRVAFQEPPRGDYPTTDTDALMALVRRHAECWTLGEDGTPVAGISFNFLDTMLPPPVDGGSHSEGDFEVDYDVLVSLQRLPTMEIDTGNGQETVIRTPQSRLGTYCRRMNHGVPTVYIGQPDYLPNRDYFQSPEFRLRVSHEFGHILGLGHEHQNPRAIRRWKHVEAIKSIIEQETSLKLTNDLIKEEITSQWPGNQQYSDWRPVVDNARCDSVMGTPLFQKLIENGSPKKLPTLTVQPTQEDITQLIRMYPPSSKKVRASAVRSEGTQFSPTSSPAPL